MNLNKLFLNYCKKNNLETNHNQLNLIEELNLFYNQSFSKSFLKKIFTKQNSKKGFYLQGDVGVGKTMILNFFYNNFDKTKQRFHFNEFMISFHDFVFKNKKNNQENIIEKFVKKFVITEATYTHNGNRKKLNFDINKFKKFKDKITYIVVDEQPKNLLLVPRR